MGKRGKYERGQGGVHTTVTVKDYFGLGQEQNHKQQSVFEADHPETFAATDDGITPIEYLLVGLASCLSAGVASVARYAKLRVCLYSRSLV